MGVVTGWDARIGYASGNRGGEAHAAEGRNERANKALKLNESGNDDAGEPRAGRREARKS